LSGRTGWTGWTWLAATLGDGNQLAPKGRPGDINPEKVWTCDEGKAIGDPQRIVRRGHQPNVPLDGAVGDIQRTVIEIDDVGGRRLYIKCGFSETLVRQVNVDGAGAAVPGGMKIEDAEQVAVVSLREPLDPGGGDVLAG